MNSAFNGKAAIVTGASKGIGRAIAMRLAKEGARTVLCARTKEQLEANVQAIEKAGGKAAAIALDLRLPESPARLAAFAVETFGRIDVVVNNAGATKRGDFLKLADDDWADGFALKFFGAMRLTRAAWPHLKKSSGSLVFISGGGGRTPGPQFTIGGSVNAAILSFTKAMAELGVDDHVQVNTINPGSVRTDRFKHRLEALAKEKGVDLASAEKIFVEDERLLKVGEPEDIAALVAFVAGPEGRFLHGSLIDMDGGATKTI